MKQFIRIDVEYDDQKFAQRAPDVLHATLEGIRRQYGADVDSGITAKVVYDSTGDPNWAIANKGL